MYAFGQKDTIKTDTLKTPLSSLADEYRKYLPNFSPLSPNAAAIQKYGDYSVSMEKGLVDISIPIYTIQAGSLSLPIVLRNHASGHPLSEFASWIGWGWSLDFGGAVNRTINGLADDKKITQNYLNTLISAWNLCNSSTDYANAQNVNNDSYDLEPDLFSYSTPEVSGKFYLRQGGQPPFLIPFQPVKITHDYVTTDTLKTFQVVAPSGNEYVFGGNQAHEKQSVMGIGGSSTLNGIVTWNLTKILSPNTNDAILLNYQDGGSIEQSSSAWSASATFYNGTPVSYSTSPNESISSRTNTARNIQTITYPNGEVEFIQSTTSERLDLSNSPFLKEIKVYNYENGVKTLLKKFVFRYSYFLDRTGANGRLKLNKLVEFNANSTDSLVHSFDYFTNTYSWKVSEGGAGNADLLKQDYFGYYNGKPNNHLIDIASYNGVSILDGVADRSTVDTYMKEGVLSKITYPTGGFTTFDFEVNKYKQLGVEKLAGGLRIKEIRNFTGVGALAFLKRYEYSSEDGSGIGKLTNTWSSPSSGMVGYINNAVGDQLHKTDFIGSNGMSEMGSFEGTPIYYTTVKEFADSLGQANGYSEYQFSFEPDISVTTTSSFIRDIEPWKRGLLLNHKVYNSAGILVQNIVNTYQEFKQQFITNLAKVNLNNNANTNCSGCSVMPSGFATPEGLSVCGYPQYSFFTGNSKTGQMKQVSSISTIDNVTSTQSIVYDNNLFPIKTISDDSKTNSYRQKISIYSTHSSYDADAIALDMRSRNMIGIPLESIEKDSISGVLTTNFHQKTIYDSFTGNNARNLTNNILPKEIWVAPKGISLEKRVEFTNYDTDGNPTEYKVDGIPTALIWGYNGSLLLGQVQNATISAVNTALTSAGITAATYSLTSLSNTQLTALNTFRNALPNSLVSWFTYRPQVGMSSSIAPNGLRSSFEYDAFTRLANIKDHDDNKITEYNYFYGSTNRVTTTQYRVDKNGSSLGSPSPSQPQTTYPPSNLITHEYFDGLGRFIQKVAERRSPSVKDIVLGSQTYDKYGRVSQQMTVFPSSTDDGSYQSNFLSLAQSFYGDSHPYSTPIYEASPLNRSRQVFGLGSAWYSADKKTQMFDESAGSAIRDYTIDASGNITLNGFYPANSLYQKRTIDEQGNASIEIIDKRGRLIQKQVEKSTGDFLITYYIYDGLGRVLAVLQPNAFALNNSISQSSADWSNGVFFYKYDNRGRAIEKHVPNGGFTHIVYDKADREVMNQDAHQRTLNLWSFTKYDGLNRVVISGELMNTNPRNTLQTAFDGHTTLSETFDSTAVATLYYSNVSFPFGVDSSRAMEVNFYDNYSGWRDAWHGSFSSTPYENAKGLLTGTQKRYTESRQWQVQSLYYDKRNRLIYSRKDYLNNSIPLPISHVYLFDGLLWTQSKFLGSSSIFKTYGYDFAGRKEQFNLNLDNSSSAFVKYAYNGIGQLAYKKIQPDRQYSVADVGSEIIYRPPALEQPNTQDVASRAVIISPPFSAVASDANTQTYLAEIDTVKSNVTDAMQTIDYGYHLRGQVNCMNCRNKQVRLGNKQNDLFTMKLDFEDDKRYYDGNISRQTWKTPYIANAQQYTHSYDGASRLIKSLYSGGVANSNYSLDSIAYDHNGNIQLLKRHAIDNLSYVYNGNQLLSVTDNGGTTAGFNDGNTAGNDYGYWDNGDLKFDKNKGIDSIVYNSYLKRVSRVKFSNGNSINFFYDGGGTLLKRKLSNGDEWVYQDEIVWKNGKYYQINHDEGRAVRDTVANKWKFEFDYRDILGNLRVSFRDSLAAPVNDVYAPPVVTQVHETDAFGLQIDALSYENAGNNPYKFQNQLKVNDYNLGWNFFKYRYSDESGRFWQIDPLAEKYLYNSPYALQENKFGRGVELEGLEMFPFPALFTSEPVVVRPVVEPVPTRPIIEPVTRSTVRTTGGKPKWDSGLTPEENIQNMQKLGRETHVERQAEWQKEGYKTEVQLDKGNRADGLKIEKSASGEKTGYLRELKPNTKSGQKAGVEQLTRYVDVASKKYPDVSTWKLELELYYTPAPADATMVSKPIDKSKRITDEQAQRSKNNPIN